jgi:hypothetical protein
MRLKTVPISMGTHMQKVFADAKKGRYRCESGEKRARFALLLDATSHT